MSSGKHIIIQGSLLPAGSNSIYPRSASWKSPLPSEWTYYGGVDWMAEEVRPFRYRDDNGLVHRILKRSRKQHRHESACGLEFRHGLLTKVGNDVALNCFGCMEFEKERR